MDDNVKNLIDELIDVSVELERYKEREKQLCRFLWNAELKDAKDAKKYEWKYSESLEDTNVKAMAIRDIFGFMPCPEAVDIYNECRKNRHEDDEDE